jgi:bifunctional UDP-N-acetylglucosamine pyrophosphorylase/glucosamine-1-phosphate N-acetyltransferase
MSDLHVVVLAAGKGTRMKSAVPKVLHRLCGLPLIEHVLRTARALGPATTTIVIGHGARLVEEALTRQAGLRFVVQEPQLGTAHALLQAEPVLAGRSGTLLMLSGDVPLLRSDTVRRLLAAHAGNSAAVTVLTALVGDASGYGRIVRENGSFARIVEERDASAAERAISEINSGVYAFDLAPLFVALRSLGSQNTQREYYLPDIVAAYRREGRAVEAVLTDNPDEIRGINSRRELADMNAVLWQSRNNELMSSGVTIEDPNTTYVGPDVSIAPDTVLHPGVHLEGRTQIGPRCEIHSGVRIVDSILDEGVVVRDFCLIVGSRLASGAAVGPFAHIRPNSEVGPGARVGNFVELKKAVLGAGAKANHLAYLGDATIGARTNIGAGTITCNYDGTGKYQTVVEDDVFVGSDSQLIAPVRIGTGAYIAAGSSITDDVPAGALAIARGRQVNKEGWAEKKKGGRTHSQ